MASSPAVPNAGVAGFMKKYRTFVRRHRALLSAIEQGAAGMTWFIEGENSEVYAEAASSVVGVMSTLNDHLVADESDDDGDVGDAHSSPGTRGEIDSAYGNESDGGAAPDGGIGDRRRGSGGRDAKRSTWRERPPIRPRRRHAQRRDLPQTGIGDQDGRGGGGARRGEAREV